MHLRRFYELLEILSQKVDGEKMLQDCHGRMPWPKGGVYFFYESGEKRSDSGEGLRVVRVGTHALTEKSKSTLWGRLSQHKGTAGGGGNHRGSIFRLLVGAALKRQGILNELDSWGVGASLSAASEKTGMNRDLLKSRECAMEDVVSQVIGRMPFVCLRIDGDAQSPNLRSYIEKNAIALLSGYERPDRLDPPSDTWLGLNSDRKRVQKSGLWNNDYVDAHYESDFLVQFERLIRSY